ncbi:MAG: DUF971 domain-containing protein [Planctomycetota bacterium]
MKHPVPQSISRIAQGGIEVAWSDGSKGTYSPRLLRDACPCATCREQRVQRVEQAPPALKTLLTVLKPEEVAPLAIAGMKPVGQYAYSIEFSDGHSSGIYTLEYLRELA